MEQHAHDDGTVHAHEHEHDGPMTEAILEGDPVALPPEAQMTTEEILKYKLWECFMNGVHQYGLKDHDAETLDPKVIHCMNCQREWAVGDRL